MQVSASTNASLLDYVNSMESSTSTTAKKGGISSLFQQSCVASNPILTKAANQVSNASLYKATVTNASSVLQYLNTLKDNSDNSVFAKAESENNTDTVVTKIGSMVVSYNKLLSNLSEEGGKTNKAYIQSLQSTVSASKDDLEKIGITINSDGSLNTDYDKLCSAGLSDLKTAFGNASSLSEALSDGVTNAKTAAEKTAKLAQIYSTAYSNSGSYSQYEYIKNFYNSEA